MRDDGFPKQDVGTSRLLGCPVFRAGTMYGTPSLQGRPRSAEPQLYIARILDQLSNFLMIHRAPCSLSKIMQRQILQKQNMSVARETVVVINLRDRCG